MLFWTPESDIAVEARDPHRIMRQRAIFRVLYFFYWAAVASLIPFLSLYLHDRGLSGRQIGLLLSMPYLATILSPVGFGFLLDFTRKPKRIVQLAVTGLIISSIGLGLADEFMSLIFAVVIYAIFSSPINPILDRIVLDWLSESTAMYGRIRLAGSIGFGISAIATGLIIGNHGLRWIFPSYLALIGFFLFATLLLPRVKLDPSEDLPEETPMSSFFSRSFLLFSMGILGWGIGESSIANFMFLHVRQMGGTEGEMGILIGAAIIGEIIAFSYVDRVIEYLGEWKAIAISIGLQGLRLLAISWAPDILSLLIIQFFGGASFSLVWSGGVSYVDTVFPRIVGASAQGIRTALQLGVGGVLGAIASGWIYDKLGSTMIFRIMGILVFLGMIPVLFDKIVRS